MSQAAIQNQSFSILLYLITVEKAFHGETKKSSLFFVEASDLVSCRFEFFDLGSDRAISFFVDSRSTCSAESTASTDVQPLSMRARKKYPLTM